MITTTTGLLLRSGRAAAAVPAHQALGSLVGRQTRCLASSIARSAKHAMDKRDTRVAAAALTMLDSKRKLLEEVAKAPAHYTAVDDLVGASLGAHMRHSLDHFAKLLAESDSSATLAEVHYDNRERHTAIESDVGAAIKLVDTLAAKIVKLGAAPMREPIAANFMLEVKGLEHRIESTLERELFFCTHHAVHHMAMIALILKRLGGYDPTLTIAGRAPSTRYDDQRAA